MACFLNDRTRHKKMFVFCGSHCVRTGIQLPGLVS